MPQPRSGSKRRPFREEDLDSVVDLLEALPRLHVSEDGAYTFRDRATDFMAVFNGDSTADQGRRVLAQIAQICDPTIRITDADKHGTLAFKSGQRRVMQEIMLCMVSREPVRVEKRTTDNEPSSNA